MLAINEEPIQGLLPLAISRRQVTPVGIRKKIARALWRNALGSQRAEFEKSADSLLVRPLQVPGKVRLVQRLAPVGKNHLRHGNDRGLLVYRRRLGYFWCRRALLHLFVFATALEKCKAKFFKCRVAFKTGLLRAIKAGQVCAIKTGLILEDRMMK